MKLIITNGGSAVSLINKLSLDANVISWDDVLHDGPVPSTNNLDEFSEKRSEYISSIEWETFQEAEKRFKERNTIFYSHKDYSEIVLWFEHDLYDQLQLIQILNWFNEHRKESNITLVQQDYYIGHTKQEDLIPFFDGRIKISDEHFTTAAKAWSYFTSGNPENFNNFINLDISNLPFLKSSLIRIREEFPDRVTGLSRTESQILNLVLEGVLSPKSLFIENMKKEEAVFLGDWSFFYYMNDLASGENPAIEMELLDFKNPDMETFLNQEIKLTDLGMDVLKGKENWFIKNNREKWIGGFKLTVKNLWCWDKDLKKLIYTNSVR